MEPPHPDELPPDGIEDIDWSTRTADLAKAASLRERTDPDFTEVELRRVIARLDIAGIIAGFLADREASRPAPAKIEP